MQRICMGQEKDIRLTFLTHDCVKTRKHKMTYLFQGASSSIFTTVRIRNLFLVASVQRDALFKARISQIVYLS